MSWEGEYHVKCPKCGCKKIWCTEITKGISEHLIDNGVWNHFYDSNDYGIIERTSWKCDSCGHVWSKPLATIEYYNVEDINERRKFKSRKSKKIDNPYIKEMKELVKKAEELSNKFKELNDEIRNK